MPEHPYTRVADRGRRWPTTAGADPSLSIRYRSHAWTDIDRTTLLSWDVCAGTGDSVHLPLDTAAPVAQAGACTLRTAEPESAPSR
jgi:hypothetical protein